MNSIAFSPQPKWLRQYGNAEAYTWRPSSSSTTTTTTTSNDDGESGMKFSRAIGLVEYAFDTDGRHFEGRADMNCLLTLAFQTRQISPKEFRQRILLAWTTLRCQHLLLQARTVRKKNDEEEDDEEDDDDVAKSVAPEGLHFTIDVPRDVEEARERAEKQLVFLEDFYEKVDAEEFYMHCQNGGRVVDPEVALAKVFVLPLGQENGGEGVLKVLFVGGHMIWDGLSSYVWMRDFITRLNQTPETLQRQIHEYIQPSSIQTRAPLPQEALYPPIHPGNRARQRWFWTITRILRHVRKPLPEGFSNPLRLPQGRRRNDTSFSPIYSKVLNYTTSPPNTTNPTTFHIPAAENLHRICKSVHASIGAGIFALVALTMMEFHEHLHPEIPLQERKAFITGFPLNPRAFFNHYTDPDCCMLAFSDGISLPFLPSHLPVQGRLRLLIRQAHRQLQSYQKRPNNPPPPHHQGPEEVTARTHNLNSRAAGLVLANQYLYSLERVPGFLQQKQHTSSSSSSPPSPPQGIYPARQNPTSQTCGVSSVGLRDRLIRRGHHHHHHQDNNKHHDDDKLMVVDFRDLTASVRAREGEFLVGAGGSEGGIFGTVSVDSSIMDQGLVGRWRERMLRVLDEVHVDVDVVDRGGGAKL